MGCDKEWYWCTNGSYYTSMVQTHSHVNSNISLCLPSLTEINYIFKYRFIFNDIARLPTMLNRGGIKL